jgi:DNA-binding transcriptional LysR family regulator
MDRLTGLQLFIRVVETGSFSKAADELRVAQPTATKHVAALESRLGARLLHRSTRGVTPTEVGALYYEKCKAVVAALDEADSLAAGQQGSVGGTLRVTTSVGFGRRVLGPLVLRYMREQPALAVDVSFDDRYVNLVEQGIDVAVRMGRLADSTLGARYLGLNPWVMVAAPAYLERRGTPGAPAELSAHDCLIYSSVQGDERWHLGAPGGETLAVPVRGPLRSNNLTLVLDACVAGLGIAILPWYVAHDAVAAGQVTPLLADHALPAQPMHAVFPSPKLLPAKVGAFIAFLQAALDGDWWKRAP